MEYPTKMDDFVVPPFMEAPQMLMVKTDVDIYIYIFNII